MVQRSLISPPVASTRSRGTSRPSPCRCFGSTTRCVTARATGSTITRITSPQAPSLQLASAPIVNGVVSAICHPPSPARTLPPLLTGCAAPFRREAVSAARLSQREAGTVTGGHGAWSAIRLAASSTAARICSYPVQRHRLPASASRICGPDGSGLARSRSCAGTSRPGVEKPHCTAPASRNACCKGCRSSPLARPSTVTMLRPCAWPASTRQAQTARPSRYTVHDPHSPCSHAFFDPGRPIRSRSTNSRFSPSQTSSTVTLSPLTVAVIRMTVSSSRAGSRAARRPSLATRAIPGQRVRGRYAAGLSAPDAELTQSYHQAMTLTPATSSASTMPAPGGAGRIADQGILDRTVSRFRDAGIVLPTFAELAEPARIPHRIQRALDGVRPDDPQPLNLFRAHWYNGRDRVSQVPVPVYAELPSELTGVDARIVVAIGELFPMIRAHKVLAAYGCLAPRVITGQFDPTANRAIWPSTGNYCRGGVAISRLMQCRGVAVLPEGMSRERFAWLEDWVTDPGDIIKTPGTESNVKEIYDKCAELALDRKSTRLNSSHLG